MIKFYANKHPKCLAEISLVDTVWSLMFVIPEASSNVHDNGTTRDSLGGNTYMLQIEVNKSNYSADTLLLRIHSCSLKIFSTSRIS